MGSTERELSVVRDLLDMQVIDREARPVGRVDDLEIAAGGALTAILAGGTAVADRIRGRLGRTWAAAYRWLLDDRERASIRIPIANVLRVDSRVDLDVARADLGTGRLDAWLDRHVIERIPGHGYAPE